MPHDVLDRLSRLPDDLDAAAFHLAVESALVALRFSVQREVRVPDRGDGHGGRLDLVAERHGLRIAFELDDRTPRQKSIAKLEGADCQVRVIVLRCPADGPLPDVGGQVRVIGAGASIPEPEDIAPTTMDDVTLWATALAQVTDGMLPANAEKLAALEPLGRGPDGGLRLRAPPWADAGRFQGAVRAALVNAGDECGARATIVTT